MDVFLAGGFNGVSLLLLVGIFAVLRAAAWVSQEPRFSCPVCHKGDCDGSAHVGSRSL